MAKAIYYDQFGHGLTEEEYAIRQQVARTKADHWIEDGVEEGNSRSSTILRIRYNKTNRELHVQFRGYAKGKRQPKYIYHNVPVEVAKAFYTALSLGKFHAWSIKNVYHCEGPL